VVKDGASPAAYVTNAPGISIWKRRRTYGAFRCDDASMSVGCELPVTRGTCDVGAIGRCVDCERAFCLTHQAVDNLQRPFSNLCTECSTARTQRGREAVEQSQQARIEQITADRYAIDNVKASIATTAERLRRAGSPGLSQRSKVVGQKQTMLGWGPWRDVRKPLDPGWSIGSFEWRTFRPALTGTFESDAQIGTAVLQTWVLADGTVVADPGGYTVHSATGATRPSELAQWQAIERAFTQMARRLLS
jgi:hypothetical protein